MIDEKKLLRKVIGMNNECGVDYTQIIELINNQSQVQPIVRTQSDHIRNMIDEELAEFRYTVIYKMSHMSRKEFIEWLQSEVNE